MVVSWKERALSIIRGAKGRGKSKSKTQAAAADDDEVNNQNQSAKKSRQLPKASSSKVKLHPRKVAEDFFSALAEPDNAEEREKALDFIRVFVAELQDWSEQTIVLLWKGLWTCMWHSDRPLVQLETAQRIAKLINFVKRERDSALAISKPILWVAGFWKQALTGWPALDFHRIDKFLRLTRYMLYVSFQVLQEPTTTGRDVVFMERVLVAVLASEVKGLSLHVCDIWVEEATRAAVPSELHTRLLAAFFTVFSVAARMSNAAFLERMLRNVFTGRLLKEVLVEAEALEMLRKKLLKSKELCKKCGKPSNWVKEVEEALDTAEEASVEIKATEKKPSKVAEVDYIRKYYLSSIMDRKSRRKLKRKQKKKKQGSGKKGQEGNSDDSGSDSDSGREVERKGKKGKKGAVGKQKGFNASDVATKSKGKKPKPKAKAKAKAKKKKREQKLSKRKISKAK